METIKYGKPFTYGGDEAAVVITPAEAGGEEAVLITKENFEEIWREIAEGKYTHIRLITNRNYDYIIFRKKGIICFQNISQCAQIKTFCRNKLKALAETTKVYAVRKAKRGEAQWHMEIIYKNRKMVLGMFFDKFSKGLMRKTKTGKIGAIVYEGGEDKETWLDLGKLIDAKLGRIDDNGLEKWLVDALNDIEDPNFKWNITRRGLYIKLRNISYKF